MAEESLPELPGLLCRRGLTGLLTLQSVHPSPLPSPILPPWIRLSKTFLENQSWNIFSRTESPGRDSAMREAVRLEVNPAPTSRTEPEAILTKTRFHSEKITINLKVKKVEPSHWPFSRPERKLMLRVKQIWDSCRCRCWKYFKQTFLVNCHLDELFGSHLVYGLLPDHSDLDVESDSTVDHSQPLS